MKNPISRNPLRLLSFTLALILAGSLLAACAGEDDDPTSVTIALDWYPWSNHTGLYLAQENGYFEEEGLDVEIYVPGNPQDGLTLVGSGQDEFAISYQTDVLLARGEDIPVQSVAALVQHPLNSIMALESSGIERPSDLEGMTIGVPGVPSDEALLSSILAADGLTMDDVEIVNVGFTLIPPLLAGQVDAVIGAYWVHESFLVEREGEEVSVLRVEEWGVPDYYELVLVASDETVEDNPELVEGMLRAISRGYADAESDHDAALDALLAAAPDTDRALEERGIVLLAPYWTDEGSVPFGQQTAERWESYASWLKDNGMLDESVDPAEAFTNEFVEGAGED
jgi:putative hydroxymethylpyrimidine transport system substrate-binding protein